MIIILYLLLILSGFVGWSFRKEEGDYTRLYCQLCFMTLFLWAASLHQDNKNIMEQNETIIELLGERNHEDGD